MKRACTSGSKAVGLSKKGLARALFQIGAVTFSETDTLTWSSGLRVPFYCDNRLTNTFPALRSQITDSMVQCLKANGLMPAVIVGTATAGVPQATLVADRLRLPLVYVRPKPKDHGRGRQIEGSLKRGYDVVIVEDLIATGGSVLRVIDAVRKHADANVLAVVAIFTYGLTGVHERFVRKGVPLYTVTDFDTLVSVAEEDAFLPSDRIRALLEWYRDPHAWSGARAN